jgi:hypothetical protein
VREAIAALGEKVDALTGDGGRGGRGARGGDGDDATPTLAALNEQLGRLLDLVQNADAAPTTQADSAADAAIRALAEPVAQWRELKTRDVPALNAKLRGAKLPEVTVEGARRM